MKIKCIAIDDEPLALKQISSYISKTPYLEAVALCHSAFEAMEYLSDNEVDLMFVHSARLYLVSCKSGEFSKKDLIEIESLKSLAGGTFRKAFMLSLKPYSDAIIARAKQLRVKLLTPTTFGEILD